MVIFVSEESPGPSGERRAGHEKEFQGLTLGRKEIFEGEEGAPV